MLQAAQEDNHQLLHATHYVEKDGEVAGAFCVGPTVHWWMDSQKCRYEDSILVFMALETLQHQQGIQTYVMLCADESPYMRVMEQAGFEKLGYTNVFVRT